jgi:hypothetical protein
MIIFLLPALAIILLYLLDVGWARAPRGHEEKENPLEPPSRADSQARDAELHPKAF